MERRKGGGKGGGKEMEKNEKDRVQRRYKMEIRMNAW